MNRDSIETQVDCVVYFIASMDLEMLDTLIDSGYENVDFKIKKIELSPDLIFEHFFGKSGFISQLKEAFLFLKANNNTCLIPTFVKYIEPKVLLYKFKGNISRHYLELIIVINEYNRIIDCYDALNISKEHGLIPSSKNQFLIWPDHIKHTKVIQ